MLAFVFGNVKEVAGATSHLCNPTTAPASIHGNTTLVTTSTTRGQLHSATATAAASTTVRWSPSSGLSWNVSVPRRRLTLQHFTVAALHSGSSCLAGRTVSIIRSPKRKRWTSGGWHGRKAAAQLLVVVAAASDSSAESHQDKNKTQPPPQQQRAPRPPARAKRRPAQGRAVGSAGRTPSTQRDSAAAAQKAARAQELLREKILNKKNANPTSSSLSRSKEQMPSSLRSQRDGMSKKGSSSSSSSSSSRRSRASASLSEGMRRREANAYQLKQQMAQRADAATSGSSAVRSGATNHINEHQ